jgi:hypothetical protein
MFGTIDLLIASPHPADNRYPVRVLDSPAGPASGFMVLDQEKEPFKSDLLRVRGIDPDAPLRKSVGVKLFKALFSDDIGSAWNATRGWIEGNQADGLHIRLRIEPPELGLLPWELLCDPVRDEYLATAANLGLSRFLAVPEPSKLPISFPLRVLVVVESPPGVPAIDAQEVSGLEAAIEGLAAGVQVDIRRNLTELEIHSQLQLDYHVLHYLGHGTGSKLVLTSSDRKKASSVDDRSFSQLVTGRPSLRLIVLSACHSSQGGAESVFEGVGPALVRQRLPAVIAMQYNTVQVDTAGVFSAKLYEALALGRPIDLAVNQARQALSARFLPDRDWSTPVLYLGTRSFRLVDPKGEEKEEVSQAWGQIGKMATDPTARAALSALSQRFQEMASRSQALSDLVETSFKLDRLRKEFQSCVRVIELAEEAPARIDVNSLKSKWKEYDQGPWAEFEAYLKDHEGIEQARWYLNLSMSRTGIANALARIALLDSMNTVNQMDQDLAQAAADVRQQVNRAIEELRAFANQTMGHH